MAAVLVIDDDEVQRTVAARTLEVAGYQVTTAADGRSGLELTRALRPDLVLSDVVMPQLNGYQLLAAIRAEPPIASTPVILLTALSDRTPTRLGMAAGADDYLGKPYRPEELLEAVAAALRRRRAQADSLLHELHADFAAALEQQKQALASKYELQLVSKLNARWEQDSEGDQQMALTGATLLVANLLTALYERYGAGPLAVDASMRAFQAARDTLYLFGAVQVVPYGGDVLAVFDTARDGWAAPAFTRAVRSAFALQSAAAATLDSSGGGAPLHLALQRGDICLMRLHDALHGGAGCAALPGPALASALRLRELARLQGWRIAIDAADATEVPRELAVIGEPLAFGSGTASELQPPPD